MSCGLSGRGYLPLAFGDDFCEDMTVEPMGFLGAGLAGAKTLLPDPALFKPSAPPPIFRESGE